MTIALALEGSEFLPGDPVRVTVEVAGSGDDKLQGIRVELAYSNTYYERSHSQHGSHDSESTDTIRVAVEDLAAVQGALGAGSGTYEATLWLPADAPPSVEETVEWHVSAILDRQRATDRRHELAIKVLAPPTGDAPWAQAKGITDAGSGMTLELPAPEARPGETLAGVLHVDPPDGFTARGVRVELEGIMHHEDSIERTLTTEKVMLAEKTEFVPGAPQAFAFEITVPGDAAPSMRSKHNRLHWHLKGICDRRLRGDHCVEVELRIYNGPPESAARDRGPV